MSRIVSVREQIAAECQRDCETMIAANDQILASYFETQQENSRTESQPTNPENSEGDPSMESLTIPYSDRSHNKSAFDRYNAMLLLSNSISNLWKFRPTRL